jgi:DNA-binding LytR/AlgR family response regulator
MGIDYSRQAGKKITTKGTQKTCIDIENIMYIQCSGGLATIFLNDNKTTYDIKTLKTFEEELSGMGFCRVNRNTLVNGKYITKIKTYLGKRVVYLKEIAFTVARRRQVFIKKVFS